MTIIEMREKRAKLWATMEGFLDTHRNDKGVLSPEDDATYTAMEQDLNDLSNEIRRMERRDAMEAELSKPVSKPIKETPEKPAAPEMTGRASNAYKEDFGRHLRGKKPIHNVLSESVDQDGGYLVPEEFEKEIIKGLDAANVIRGLAKVFTTHHDRKIPLAIGRSVANWTLENAPFTESNPTFGQKQIDAFKLTDLIRLSSELLQDSEFNLEEYIAAEFARAFGVAEEEAFCVGTGVNQPTGIFTANGGEVGVTAAATNAITADELISLVYALKSPYRRNANFLMNDATVSMIRKLKDGNGAYLWQPPCRRVSRTDCSAMSSTPVPTFPLSRAALSPLPSAISRTTGSATALAEPCRDSTSSTPPTVRSVTSPPSAWTARSSCPRASSSSR